MHVVAPAQHLDDRLRGRRVGGHPQVQGADPAVHEEAVEGRRHRADRVLHEPQPLVMLGRARDRGAADDVGVAAEVLRRRVHDEVGAELERPLVDRGGERVVDRDEGVALARHDPRDVDHVEQRVGRRLDPDQLRLGPDRALDSIEVGLVDEVVGQPPAREHLVDQAEGASVEVVRQHDVRARRAGRRDHRVLGGEP
jgi:hypothetical protein